jgi:hypothetical protein
MIAVIPAGRIMAMITVAGIMIAVILAAKLATTMATAATTLRDRVMVITATEIIMPAKVRTPLQVQTDQRVA